MLRRTLRRCSAAAVQPVKIIECPRDAMQGLKEFIPTDQKIRYINKLMKVGYDTLDLGSFVAAPAVPQMRDTAEVLAGLEFPKENAPKSLVVVCNLKGAKRGAEYDVINYLGYPLSACETFQRKNTNRDIATALIDLQEVKSICDGSKKELVTFISMGFGNPYGEEFNEDIVNKLVEKVAAMGVKTIVLSDTVGVSEPGIITRLFETVIPRFPDVEFGAHFHSQPATTEEKVVSAYKAGCRRFDCALGGMGGCPFAKSTLVGNISTEGLIEALKTLDVPHTLDAGALAEASEVKHEVFGVGMKELVLAQALHDEKMFRDLCIRHFHAADFEGNEYLTPESFARAVKNAYAELGEPEPSDEDIAKKFDRTDLSHDGRITFEEYMVGARRGLVKRLKNMV